MDYMDPQVACQCCSGDRPVGVTVIALASITSTGFPDPGYSKFVVNESHFSLHGLLLSLLGMSVIFA